MSDAVEADAAASALAVEVDALLLVEVERGGAALRYAVEPLLLQTQSEADTRAFPALLPLLGCEAAGADPRLALPAAAAWRALHLASVLFDDVVDADAARAGGQGTVASYTLTANALCGAAILLLSRLPDAARAAAPALVGATVLRMAAGQYGELANEEALTVEGCLRMLGDKAGSFYAAGTVLGVRCAGTDWVGEGALEEAAYNGGILLQLVDDLYGFHEEGLAGDIANRRPKATVAYVHAVANESERLRLDELLAAVPGDCAAEAEAREFMRELGAETYLALEIARYRQRTLAALERVPGDARPIGALRRLLVG